ncbi:MAG TPA: DUF1385 domain-containing protein [candidate division Zixibacteria bacterium]|nr:DUF1385 domain-containing protein [candidate division Zixibacteria bacterium]
MPDLNVGGQAVIEGVMMRSADRVATAVRRASGEIEIQSNDFVSLTKRKKFMGLPIIRGAVSLFEMLVIGIRTLNYSASVAAEDIDKAEGKEPNNKSNNFMLGVSAVIAFALGIGIFFFLPLLFSQLAGVKKEALWFNLIAGAIRAAMFLAYVWALSKFSEFRRVFEYHGAEHKSIFAYESGEDLVAENAVKYTRLHPRCGTSFILIVVLLAILTYSISDTIFYLITGYPPALLTRFGIHLLLLPLVAGVSYELLKLSGKTRDNKLTQIMIQPGLWLQKITTQEPDLSQLEVAMAALRSSLGMEAAAKAEAKKAK